MNSGDSGIGSYRGLRVWQEGMNLAEACYRLTRGFPRDELYGMTSQIRRCTASIPANIAEGYGRAGKKEYVQFLFIAQGSLKELETHVILSTRVGLVDDASSGPVLQSADRLGRMLRTLIRALHARHPTPDTQRTE